MRYVSVLYRTIFGICVLSIMVVMTFNIIQGVWSEVPKVLILGLFSSLRVMIFIGLSTLLWLPIGVWVGQRPRVSTGFNPLFSFLLRHLPNFFVSFVCQPNHYISVKPIYLVITTDCFRMSVVYFV